jgi:hypothetical protein
VKVLVRKHCGFMQFVWKADVERAIEKRQGLVCRHELMTCTFNEYVALVMHLKAKDGLA